MIYRFDDLDWLWTYQMHVFSFWAGLDTWSGVPRLRSRHRTPPRALLSDFDPSAELVGLT